MNLRWCELLVCDKMLRRPIFRAFYLKNWRLVLRTKPRSAQVAISRNRIFRILSSFVIRCFLITVSHREQQPFPVSCLIRPYLCSTSKMYATFTYFANYIYGTLMFSLFKIALMVVEIGNYIFVWRAKNEQCFSFSLPGSCMYRFSPNFFPPHLNVKKF